MNTIWRFVVGTEGQKGKFGRRVLAPVVHDSEPCIVKGGLHSVRVALALIPFLPASMFVSAQCLQLVQGCSAVILGEAERYDELWIVEVCHTVFTEDHIPQDQRLFSQDCSSCKNQEFETEDLPPPQPPKSLVKNWVGVDPRFQKKGTHSLPTLMSFNTMAKASKTGTTGLLVSENFTESTQVPKIAKT
eukprot:4866903-Amphidinium_carterae.1